MGTDGGPGSVNRDTLADELRQLMALRSRSSVRDRSCPELDQLLDAEVLASRDARYAAVAELIDTAAAAIPDPSHRAAAVALLGSGDGRWRTVSQRGADAAAAFGCGWDAYRRRRTNGSSQLDDTLRALADSMVASTSLATVPPTPPAAGVERSSAATTAAGPAPASSRDVVRPVVIGPLSDRSRTDDDARQPPAGAATASPARSAGRSRRRLAVVAVAVVLVAVAGGVAYLTLGDTGEEPAAPVCSLLDEQVGALPEGATAEMRTWSTRFRAFARTLPPDAVQCAGIMEWRDGLVIQPVASPTPLGVGAIVAADDPGATLVHLDYLEYWSYRTAIDQFGVEMVGTPVRRSDRDGTTLVMLTRGAIVGEAAPVSFVIMGTVWQEWIERGGIEGEMGRPISKMRDLAGGVRVQDFERGRLAIDLAEPTDVTWEPIVNAEAALPRGIRDTLLRAEDGTSWYVDKDLVRHWLPTSNDYGCTGGLGSVEHTSVPAQAIATLKAGEPLRCR